MKLRWQLFAIYNYWKTIAEDKCSRQFLECHCQNVIDSIQKKSIVLRLRGDTLILNIMDFL